MLYIKVISKIKKIVILSNYGYMCSKYHTWKLENNNLEVMHILVKKNVMHVVVLIDANEQKIIL